MSGKKRFGWPCWCPRCRASHFFLVSFHREPKPEGNFVLAPMYCEKCHRFLERPITLQEWEKLKAEYEAAELSEKKNV